ncbi:hypothetical protein B0H16DRAFT_1480568 [Mycena metata]|uniref:Uncharacterized protein n=1 Tax=Mycena metata TaxID=1033252 RepID=A0AAD7MCU3_9AGAR|nr:hypothetical protein B0H16DRAFT_1480568 [Mycena metata]
MVHTKQVATHWRNMLGPIRKLNPWPFAQMQVTPSRCRVISRSQALQDDSESDASAPSGTLRQYMHLHIDLALQEKRATKLGSGWFFVGNKKMLMCRPLQSTHTAAFTYVRYYCLPTTAFPIDPTFDAYVAGLSWTLTFDFQGL